MNPLLRQDDSDAGTTNMTRTILWALAAVYALALIANISFGLSIPIALALLHR